MAVQFDEGRQPVAGELAVIASDVPPQLAVSPTGTLVHLAAAGVATCAAVWVDRRGIEEPIGLTPQPMYLLRLSPDGSRLAASSGTEIRVWTLAKGTMTRLREEEAGQWDMAWMPDGNRLLFSAGRAVATSRMVMKTADGSGAATTVLPAAAGFPNDVAGVRAAVATAAYLTARARVAPSQHAYLDTGYAGYLASVPDGQAKSDGVDVGEAGSNGHAHAARQRPG